MVERGYGPQDIEACARLRKVLDEAGEKGMDAHDLLQLHTQQQQQQEEGPQAACTRSLQQIMKVNDKHKQVVCFNFYLFLLVAVGINRGIKCHN